MDVLKAIESRLSIRSYKDIPVKPEDLANIVKAGQIAPIAGALHFSVVTNRNVLDNISEAGRQAMLNGTEFSKGRASLPGYTPLYHAPALVVISGPKGGNFNDVNAGLAAENIIIAATGLGYGSCYLYSISPLFKEGDKYNTLVGIPNNYEFCCGIIFGITDDVNAFSPVPRPAKNLDNINYVE